MLRPDDDEISSIGEIWYEPVVLLMYTLLWSGKAVKVEKGSALWISRREKE